MSTIHKATQLTLIVIAMANNVNADGGVGGALPPPFTVEKKEITREGISLAQQDCVTAQEQLRNQLSDKDWLHQLNSELDYISLGPEHIQLTFILEALAGNSSESARETINTIAADQRFRTPGPFLAVILEISKGVSTPPANLVDLWKEQLQHDASELSRTVDVVVANGSPPAIDLLENSLLNQPYREDYVISWLRDSILRHRQDLPLLQSCQRLLKQANWPKLYKSTLVEVLFDYQPRAWYNPESLPPAPPSRDQLTDEARALLLEIANDARKDRLLKWGRHRQIRKELEE